MNLAPGLNRIWMWKCASAAQTFAVSTRHVASTQAAILRTILERNRDTDFGRRHGFGRVRDPRAFQERVPLSTFEDYSRDIEQVAAGRGNVLTRDPVLLLEPTSGTTGGEKLIPYTASLRRQFQRAVSAWIGNLFRQRPAARGGRAYWSISPAFGRRRRTTGGIPIGFDDDTAYLGATERWLARRLLAAPPELARLHDIDTLRYVTLRFLLAADDLSLISVWNPTFLTALLAPLQAWGERLEHDLRTGRLTPPGSTPIPASFAAGVTPLPRRAATIARILKSSASLSDIVPQFWPQLALISCWTDAAAALHLGELRQLFPGVEIQPKGLLATEGVVSIPLCDRPGAALAVHAHFLEFQEPNGGPCRLAHELAAGGQYRAILTTAGGLYRYHLHDLIQVVGFENQCPLVRFLGKGDRISDLVGEKLAEPFVRAAIDRALTISGIRARFALLVPVMDAPARYRLYIQEVASGGNGDTEQLSAALQTELEANPHYGYAVRLRQLASVEVDWLDPRGESAERVVERRLLATGKIAGAIKPAALDAWTGWPELFAPLVCRDHKSTTLRPTTAHTR